MGYSALPQTAQASHQDQAQYLSLFGQYMAPPQQPSFVSQIDKLPPVFKVPAEGTNCLYIDGIPIDAKEREVARNPLCYPRYLQTLPWLHLRSSHH